MANINVTQIVPIDVAPGASAINYTPTSSNICPILSMTCIGSSGTGVIKLTPYRAVEILIDESNGGSGGRLRISTDAKGSINGVEIASPGSGYPDGFIIVTLLDAYGTGGEISCIANAGVLDAVTIVSPGINYSGYVTLDISDFIEGVTYDYMPRYIEHTSGTGSLRLFGNRLAVRPYQVF
jgi:hypothetical protein